MLNAIDPQTTSQNPLKTSFLELHRLESGPLYSYAPTLRAAAAVFSGSRGRRT